MSEKILRGNRILHSDGRLAPAALVLEGGRIEAVTERVAGDFDAGDLLVLPGMVDVHGDAFERVIHPRPTVEVPLDLALAETDRQMIANGITTAYHGLTVTWEPGSRDIAAARRLLAALEQSRLRCDTRVHLRHEVLSLDTVDEELDWIRQGRIALVAVNDHSHMVERTLANAPRGILHSISVSRSDYADLAKRALARRSEVPASIERLTATAREYGIPLASHDDETPEAREHYRAMGCTLCEFPADQKTAEAARRAGDHVILGSPNILRGGSHCGRVAAAEMIALDLCGVLCSDYYYPAFLQAPFRLADAGVLPLARAWELVSQGPARAAGLEDRGRIEGGCRADLILVDDHEPLHPVVRAVFTEGSLVYATQTIPASAREFALP